MRKRSLAIAGLKLAVAGTIATAVGGCSLWHDDNPCAMKEEYQTSQTVPPISIPAGLDRPDQAALLHVPDEPKPVEPLSASAGCLERPPNYFDKPVTGASN